MSRVLIGIDPGVSTGIALFVDGAIGQLQTIKPHQIAEFLSKAMPDRVVFEDSRLQSHTWTRVKSRAAALKMARNVGEVDAWCRLIEAVCTDMGIAVYGISPADKGEKIKDADFKAKTGWAGPSNQHTRDAAMVAWQHLRAHRARGA